jgi:hypothetical protein
MARRDGDVVAHVSTPPRAGAPAKRIAAPSACYPVAGASDT